MQHVIASHYPDHLCKTWLVMASLVELLTSLSRIPPLQARYKGGGTGPSSHAQRRLRRSVLLGLRSQHRGRSGRWCFLSLGWFLGVLRLRDEIQSSGLGTH